ncbi:MAG: type II toxin-antitoxin system VapC family toxin [Actinobacteria bacterium]|nr:type II toxin-antitoxin system VapC family toxin [Cyanobacteriota bacterium]MCL5771125.1 type II toxin-antitoxin system VapC family toxin [Actinomycetota bacterium]
MNEINNLKEIFKLYGINIIIIDACIGIKWFSSENEEKVEYATLIQRKNINLEIEIVIPDLFIYEILNALLIKKKLSVEDLRFVKHTLDLMNLNIIIPDNKLLDSAIEFANNLNLTYYDGIYLALAKRIDAILITEDKKILSYSHEYEFIKNLDYVQDIL